ncbi:MAG: nucleoside/nucleotide kinase family protein [Selenomonadaceae bacterium]|nr:nucleoside/nucleotide kinase family protein [Selenomonadaceae bacterium]
MNKLEENKNWITYQTEINGLPQEVRFSKGAIEKIFKPFLMKLSELHEITDRKVVGFIAAPPAVGKTTLAQFLERLSRENMEISNIRALGMDGFHYPADYLKANKISRDGQEILMNDIKGAPETFDVDTLQTKLREVRQEGTDWNIYDRMIHDVVHDVLSVEDDIILLEGNYLLLKEPRWTNIRVLADYTVFIKARPEILKERLIARKIQGGLSPEEAEKFYYASDSKNVERVLKNSAPANETWMLQSDGDFFKIEDDEDVVLDDVNLDTTEEIPFEDLKLE